MESVNVQAVNSTFGSGTDINSTIAWDFGDPGSEYNDLNGFNAAHVYANPGTYTITLAITTPDGYVGVSTQTVTVGNDNRPTVEIAAGQSLPTFQSNTRYLLQDGGTWDVDNSDLNFAGLQHVYLGSYGNGSQPVIKYIGKNLNGMVTFSSDASGITIQGLTFDSKYTSDDSGQDDAIQPSGNDLAFIGNTFLNIQDDFNLNGIPSNVLIQDNSSPNANDLDGYFAWVQGSDIAVIGNSVANSIDQADFRIGGANDVLVADNNFAKTTMIGGVTYKNCMSIQWVNYAYVIGNTLTNGPLMVGPIGTDASQDPTDASAMNVVVDSNTLTSESLDINPEAINTMVRNNVINNPNAFGIYINATEIGGGYNWVVQNLWIENNTVAETTEDGGFLQIDEGEAENVVVDNNVFSDSNLTMGDNESAYIVDTNNDVSSFSQIQNNVWGAYSQIYSWNQGGVFYVGSSPGLQADWVTPAQWEKESLSGGGSPTGDVYQSIPDGTYQVSVDGFTAGSSL